MKKLTALLLALVMVLSLCTGALAADPPKASLTAQGLTIDGEKTDPLEAYSINGETYFKLRDVAQLLRGTAARFQVGYDEATGTVAIETGKEYESVGGELVRGEDRSSDCIASLNPITIDGESVTLTAYCLRGNNFFRLRDLGDALGFFANYDAAENSMSVTTPDGVRKAMAEIMNDPEHGVGIAGLAIIKEGKVLFADTLGAKTLNEDGSVKEAPEPGRRVACHLVIPRGPEACRDIQSR